MRKGTIITGIILIVIAAAVVGYHVWDMERLETAEIHHYAEVEFDSYLGTMTTYVTWANNTTENSSAEPGAYTFYVLLSAPESCSNLSNVVASSPGASGAFVVQFNGPHDWYAVLCDPSAHRADFFLTFHQFAPTYYLVAGSGVGVLGAALIVLGRFQPPAPPLRLRNRNFAPSPQVQPPS
jgi:hypothetical protein